MTVARLRCGLLPLIGFLSCWLGATPALAETEDQAFGSVAAEVHAALAAALPPVVTLHNPDDAGAEGDGSPQDHFASAIAIEGDTAIVGVPDDLNRNGRGSVLVFTRELSTWTRQATLLPDPGANSVGFGSAVALHGDTVVVGAPADTIAETPNVGSVYVFTRIGSNWTRATRLLPDAQIDRRFGEAVAIEGDIIVVGVPDALDDSKAATGATYVFASAESDWQVEQRLLATDRLADANFGQSVAISNGALLVGAPNQLSEGPTSDGAAYLFERNASAWTQHHEFRGSNMPWPSGFGRDVALDGDTAVIGAMSAGTGQGGQGGAAFVFLRSAGNWLLQQQLNTGTGTRDLFGYDVALEGDQIVVGAIYRNFAGIGNVGGAYLFERSGGSWTQHGELIGTSVYPTVRLGHAVALSNGTVLVGDPWQRTIAGDAAGAAFVFVETVDAWSQVGELSAGQGATEQHFGSSLALYGNTAVIGVPGDDQGGKIDAGCAYVFIRTGDDWILQAQLLAADASAFDAFGSKVAIDGDTVLVGAPKDDTPPNFNHGAAYVFVRDDGIWSQQAKLITPDANYGDEFGTALAVSAETAFVGAPYNDANGLSNSGATYVFTRSGATWTEQEKLFDSSSNSGAHFGWALAVDGSRLLVGAPRTNTILGSGSGSAFLFANDGVHWAKQHQFMPSDAIQGDFVGSAVALSGQTALIGLAGDDTAAGPNSGSVRVFVEDAAQWQEQADLTGLLGTIGSTDGDSLALQGDLAIARGRSGFGDYAPTVAHVFRRNDGVWTRRNTLWSPSMARTDRYASAIAINGDFALIGASGASGAASGNVGVGESYLIGTAPQVELSVTITNGRLYSRDGESSTYAIVAYNSGPDLADGATLIDVLPPTLVGANWQCRSELSNTPCPSVSSGSGDLIAEIDLDSGRYLRFDLTAVVQAGGAGAIENTALITAAPGNFELWPGDESATDSDAVALFGDSFESTTNR